MTNQIMFNNIKKYNELPATLAKQGIDELYINNQIDCDQFYQLVMAYLSVWEKK